MTVANNLAALLRTLLRVVRSRTAADEKEAIVVREKFLQSKPTGARAVFLIVASPVAGRADESRVRRARYLGNRSRFFATLRQFRLAFSRLSVCLGKRVALRWLSHIAIAKLAH